MNMWAKAAAIIREADLDRITEAARMDGRMTCRIDADLWDRLRPAARLLCGEFWREMHTPWRAFMYDGTWIERGK